MCNAITTVQLGLSVSDFSSRSV